VKTYILLKNKYRLELPPEFQHDDVRYSESLVEYFLEQFTQENDVVFDPFAGFGTTLLVAESMKRIPFGLEFDERRVQYVQSMLKNRGSLIKGDARQLLSYNLPAFDFSITSPPYMGKYDTENPLTAYTTQGNGYEAYLQDIRNIYLQVKQIMKPNARVVIEVSNLKGEQGLTTLAWDIGRAVAQVLHFEGEIIVGWEDGFSYGYNHSYCLIFSKRT
jgi:DNA modification methylase